MKYRNKETIEAIGFEEFIQIGLSTEGANIRDGVPWSFDYNGAYATHEEDDRYLISGTSHFGELFSIEFERGEFLVTDSDGRMFAASSEWLNDHYEVMETDPDGNPYTITPESDLEAIKRALEP